MVADEVRNLAKRTQDSTEEIGKMLGVLTQSAQQANQSMEQCLSLAGSSSDKVLENQAHMKPLFEALARLSGLFDNIATAAQEQSQVSGNIHSNIQEIDDGASAIVTLTQDVSMAMHQLELSFTKTSDEIHQFRV